MITLLLIDDHQMFLDGLKEVFIGLPDMKILGTANDGASGLELVAKLAPDVVLLDMTMPGMSGLECARTLARVHPNVKVIALSMHNDLRFIGELLRIGAKGYVLKDTTSEDLIKAVRQVKDGNYALSDAVVQSLVDDYLRLRAIAHDPVQCSSPITDRERSVLTLMAEGLTGKAIGEKLSISKNTVDTHRRRMMDKLGCNSVAELIRYALREGLIDLS